ncbi:3-ketodihydrosphingosine reductase-like isoform X2 [Physella acuta]|nr:3-ketodihydrosphingosine reductase-like isoform X2 [Physella acuta]XP_059167965.1 3-ketodihydrosphingosine reductase-like isoform X2 [Physella acuta]XP_059167966.1 3-ketodihydrosphingosine reductase-like isoform X2 [Physella acuta]
MWGWIALAVFIVFIIILYLLSPLISPQPIILHNAHVIITGGSSGIGKALAVQAVQQGAKVTIVARDKAKLEETKAELASFIPDEKVEERVQLISVDLSKDYVAVENALHTAESNFGPVECLINCAGTSSPGRFEELPITDFKKMMDINYLSAVHATRAIIPSMKIHGRGRIVFVSSQAGQLGLFGFTAYSASKFALRGLAEALQMEVKPYNIHLTLAFPPDTNTPGFQEEQKTKPIETKLISETSGLFTPENVASIILADTVRGRFFSTMGLDGLMLACVTCGFSPVTSLMEATQQVITMGLFRIISLFYLDHFDRIVHRCKLEKDAKENSKKMS